MDEEKIETLKIENLIWVTYILFAIFGIKANNMEIDDIMNNTEEHKKEYKTINVVILSIAILIYIYFVNLTYRRYKKNKNKINTVQAIGATLILIAGFLFLYAELCGDEVVPNEI